MKAFFGILVVAFLFAVITAESEKKDNASQGGSGDDKQDSSNANSHGGSSHGGGVLYDAQHGFQASLDSIQDEIKKEWQDLTKIDNN